MALKVSFGSKVVEAGHCLRIERPKIAGLHLSCHCGDVVKMGVKRYGSIEGFSRPTAEFLPEF